jgi:peptidoglycan hydrolase-like protein with peptidoglycan-binding domain
MMLKKIATALLVAAILANPALSLVQADTNTDDIIIKKGEESDNVVLLQLRLQDLGYYNYKITGFFGDFTLDSLKNFQKTNGITEDGIAGKKTLDLIYSNTAKRQPVEPRVKPTPVTIKNKKYGNLRDWFTYVNNRWPRLSKAKVVDFDTGKSYYMIRVGGHYHADVEPATKKDCATFKSTYGGEWSWDRRAVIVYLGGEAIAASTNGMPHGYETIANNGMTDQVCIHFLNSRTHIHNMIDPAHQRQIKRAAGIIK